MNLVRRRRFLIAAAGLAAFGSGAWAAGSGARPDGTSAPGIGWFTTNGVLDTVYAKIDGALWYSNGGAFTNISAGIGGTAVETFQTPSRDFVWAGSDAGVWVSFDRGATATSWQARNNGLTCLGTKHAAVTNSGTLYVSTRCNQVDAVFRSFDRGLNWQQMAALPGAAPLVNRMSRAADTTQSTLFVYTSKGSFRSNDTSTSWTADQSLSGAPFRSVPAGSDVIQGFQTARSVCAMLVRDVGPYRTENCPIGGTSQPQAALQSAGLPTLTAFGKRFGLVNNELLIPVIGDGVYRFDTASTSWVRAYSDAQVPGIEYVVDITAGSATLLATSGTNGIWRSTDSGLTWQPFGLATSVPTPAPAPPLIPVTSPPQTTFSVPTGQLPEAAIASVAASDDIRSLTVVVQLDLSKILGTPSQSFAAVSGYNVYVVAAVPGERLGAAAGTKFYYQRAATELWGQLTSPIAAFVENVALGAADQRVTVEIVRDTDLSALIGTEIYIGYGTSDSEMLQARRYRGIYIVQPGP